MKNLPIRVILLLDVYAILCMLLLSILFAEVGLPEFSLIHGFSH
jgi:hypothetical protein